MAGVEGISDLLKCYICMDKLRNACICPHCSKISCFPCIMQWLKGSSRSDCPHCRARLTERELIRIPFFDEINQHIDSVKKKNGRLRTGNEMCTTHAKHALTVYCQTCFKCICHECALWGQHKGHSVKPLDELYEQKKNIFTAELHKLKERMREVLILVEQVEMKMEGVKTLRAKTQDEIDTTVNEIKGRLNEQLKVKLQKLNETRRYLKRQAYEIGAISTEMEGKMTGPVSELVTQSEELNKRLGMAICELKKKQQSELELPPSVGGFTNEVVPAYESSFFIIHPFSKLQEKGEDIYSDPLNFCGLSWRLKVYPNGTGQCEGRYLGVFVELYAGYKQSAEYHYAVEMVHGAGMYKSTEGERNHSSRNYCREYGSDFAVEESWGYKKFYEIAKLGPEGFLVKDTLMLKFSVRHPTYHQKCRDLTMYTNNLKRKIMAMKQQNGQLQQKLDSFMEGKPPSKHSHSHSSPAHTGSATSSIAKTTSAQTIGGHLTPLPPQERASSAHLGRTPHLSQPQAQSSYGRRDRLHRVESDVSRRTYSRNLMAQTSRLRQQKSHQSVAANRRGEMLFQPDMTSYGLVPRRSEAKSDIPMSVREQRRRSYDPMLHNYDQRLLYAQQQQQQHSSAHMSMLNLGTTSLSQQDYQHRLNFSMMDGEGFSGTAAMHQSPHHQVQQSQHSNPSVVISGSYFDTGSDSGSPTEDINFMLEESSQLPTHTVGVMTSQLAPNSQHQLSQEVLDFYEHSDMLSLKTLTQGEEPTITPMCSNMGLEMSQEGEMPYQREMLFRPSCSQPHTSPPQVNRLGRGHYRMSLNDLSAITSSGNNPTSSTLGESQFLSHSMHTLHEEPPMHARPEGMQRAAMATAAMSRPKAPPHHRSFGALNSVAGELQLSVQGPPGLAGTVAARLAAPISPLQTSTGPGLVQGRPLQAYPPLQSQQRQVAQQQSQQIQASQIQQQTMPPLQAPSSSSQQYNLASQQYGPASQQQAPLSQQQAPLSQPPPVQPSTSLSQSIPTPESQPSPVNGVAQQQQQQQREQSPPRVSLTQPTESTQPNKQEQQGKLRSSGRSYTYQREKKKNNLEGRASTPSSTQLDGSIRRLNASGRTSSNTSLSQIL